MPAVSFDRPISPELKEAGDAVLAAAKNLVTQLEGYLVSGTKSAGRRTRSALTDVHQLGKPFRKLSLESDQADI